MPRLMLLRHAKSDWKADYGYDHERPLNKRGRRAARAVGEFVTAHGLAPDLVLTSSAVRTRTTTELAASAGNWNTEIVTVADLYGADLTTVLDLVKGVSGVNRLMVVGHEPTMSGFLGRDVGKPTAGYDRHLGSTTPLLRPLGRRSLGNRRSGTLRQA